MDALILVDIQNDFLPGGALAVPDGDAVVPVANALMDRFELVVATADWHPRGHVSFADSHPNGQIGQTITVGGVSQALWPVHCVRDTPGAAFSDTLNAGRIDRVIRKGTHRKLDSYSGFFDNARRGATDLEDLLRQKGVGRVFLCGLATDYCVRATVLDALELGFQTHLVLDGCRGVDVRPGDVERAIKEMGSAGARVTASTEVRGDKTP
jgi:nicotinamidase/pyrazinamidase